MKRIFSKKMMVKIICITLIIFILAAFNSVANENKIKFVIGSASPGSTGYIHWEVCSYLANKYSTKIESSSISTSGSTEDVILLDQGKIELGHGTSLEVVAAWAGESPFQHKMEPWQVLPWTYWAQPMVTLSKYGLETYYDLEGKAISLIKKGSGTESMYTILLEEYGLFGKVRRNYLSFDDSRDALIDGLIVAFPANFSGGVEPPVLAQLALRAPYKILESDLEVLEKANERNRGIIIVKLPKESSEFLDEDLLVPGLGGIGLSTADVPDEVIYEFVKAVLENTDELHSISSVSDLTTIEYAINNFMKDYPVHPGAAKFFKEKGLWREDLIIGVR